MVTYIAVGVFILSDIVTGFMKAYYKGNINSTLLRRGLFHKASEIAACAITDLLQYFITYLNIEIDFPLVTVVATYICAMEIVSILENLCAINPRLKKLFKPYLDKLKKE